MKKAIIGSGGFAREVASCIDCDVTFFVDDKFVDPLSGDMPLSKFNAKEYEALVAVGDPNLRHRLVKSLPDNTKFFSFIHPSATIMSDTVVMGDGCIICAGAIVTTGVTIGDHCHLNLLSTVGHDSVIGDYFTASPGAKVSGGCSIGDRVYIGTNSCLKEKTSVCSDVVIGLSSGAVKDIAVPGTYVGCPLQKIK